MRRSLSVLCAVLTLMTPASTIAQTDRQQVSRVRTVISGGADINTHRRSMGLSPVKPSRRLEAAARGHAADMAQRGFFDHRGSNGSTHTARIRQQGCGGGAENIAMGPYTAGSVMAAWMESPGHRRNILLPAATHYGLSNFGDRWVLVLSRNCP